MHGAITEEARSNTIAPTKFCNIDDISEGAAERRFSI